MMQTEDGKLTLEDKREISIQIKELEKQLQQDMEEIGGIHMSTMQKLRKLRRTRDAK